MYNYDNPYNRARQVPRRKGKIISASNSGTRRPQWDSSTNNTSNLFDPTMKSKSLIFRPRSGDRNRQIESEMQLNYSSSPNKLMRKVHANSFNTFPRSLKHRQKDKNQSYTKSVVRNRIKWEPKRTYKDFLRINMENVTVGSSTSKTPIQSRGQHISNSPTSAMGNAFSMSPKVSIHQKSPNQEENSPIYNSNTSDTAQDARTLLNLDDSLQTMRNDTDSIISYISEETSKNVFSAVDESNRMRLNVNQILQGFQMLGLPATHNQIEDYVYLIHEGNEHTISFEEWKILVGTVSSVFSPQKSSKTSRCSFEKPDQARNQVSWKHSQGSQSHINHRNYDQINASNLGTHWDEKIAHEVHSRVDQLFKHAVGSSRQPLDDAEKIINSHDKECVVSPATVCSNRIALSDTLSVVHGLKTALYPLLIQADKKLHDIKCKNLKSYENNLSKLLSKAEIAAIEKNSKYLTNRLLEEIILDTIHELDSIERRNSLETLSKREDETLDKILARIEALEVEELKMCRNYSILTEQKRLTSEDTLANSLSLKNTNDSIYSIIEELNQTQNILPLSTVLALNLPAESLNDNIDSNPIANNCQQIDVVDNISSPSMKIRSICLPITTSILSGALYNSIENNRSAFEKRRQLIEATLAGTGMSQAAVVEILADMLMDDIFDICTAEMDDTVEVLSSTLLTQLV